MFVRASTKCMCNTEIYLLVTVTLVTGYTDHNFSNIVATGYLIATVVNEAGYLFIL